MTAKIFLKLLLTFSHDQCRNAHAHVHVIRVQMFFLSTTHEFIRADMFELQQQVIDVPTPHICTVLISTVFAYLIAVGLSNQLPILPPSAARIHRPRNKSFVSRPTRVLHVTNKPLPIRYDSAGGNFITVFIWGAVGLC